MKERFNLKAYPVYHSGMLCKTREEAEGFCEYMRENGSVRDSENYATPVVWEEETQGIIYLFNCGKRIVFADAGLPAVLRELGHCIYEYSDYDWSEEDGKPLKCAEAMLNDLGFKADDEVKSPNGNGTRVFVRNNYGAYGYVKTETLFLSKYFDGYFSVSETTTIIKSSGEGPITSSDVCLSGDEILALAQWVREETYADANPENNWKDVIKNLTSETIKEEAEKAQRSAKDLLNAVKETRAE